MSTEPAGSEPIRVIIQAIEDGADAEELDEIALELQNEITRLQVGGIDAVLIDEAATKDDWSNDRGIEQAIGIVLVTLASPKLITVLLETIRALIGKHAGRSFEMWLNQDQKVIVKGDMSARDYKRLVEVALSSLSSDSDEE